VAIYATSCARRVPLGRRPPRTGACQGLATSGGPPWLVKASARQASDGHTHIHLLPGRIHYAEPLKGIHTAHPESTTHPCLDLRLHLHGLPPFFACVVPPVASGAFLPSERSKGRASAPSIRGAKEQLSRHACWEELITQELAD